MDMKRLLFGASVIALTLGCARHSQVAVVPSAPTPDRIEIGLVSSEAQPAPVIPISVQVPFDDASKKKGTKVYSTKTAHLYRSPRDSAPEYYRVPRGTALYVSPTDDKRWLQVRLSKNRSAYVKADETNAALALALAQGKIADQARLSPGPKRESEPDVGDGKSSAATTKDSEVQDAIADCENAFGTLAEALDRVRSDAAGFQTAQENWPAVRNALSISSANLANINQDFGAAVQSLSSLSSRFSGSERTAFQKIVISASGMAQEIAAIRQAVTAMTDGTDWTAQIQTVNDSLAQLGVEFDDLAEGIADLR